MIPTAATRFKACCILATHPITPNVFTNVLDRSEEAAGTFRALPSAHFQEIVIFLCSLYILIFQGILFICLEGSGVGCNVSDYTFAFLLNERSNISFRSLRTAYSLDNIAVNNIA